MHNEYSLKIMLDAQLELEEIVLVHYSLSGINSALQIDSQIKTSLEKLRVYPKLGVACGDPQLNRQGYRMLITGNYLCFYRLIADTIIVYHIADGRTDYPTLLKDMGNQEAKK